MQQSAACEKPHLGNAASNVAGLSVTSDAESETPSHTMQRSVAYQKLHLQGGVSSTASTGMTPSHIVQHSASSRSGGAVGPSQTAEAVPTRRLRRGELTIAELLLLAAEHSPEEVVAKAAASRARFGG